MSCNLWLSILELLLRATFPSVRSIKVILSYLTAQNTVYLAGINLISIVQASRMAWKDIVLYKEF